MSRMVMRSYCQSEATLSDNDFAICDFYRFDPQIGGKAVFISLQMHNGYRFRYKTPRFRYAAKESQSRYGIWSFAASGLTL